MPIEWVAGDLFANAHQAQAFAHDCNIFKFAARFCLPKLLVCTLLALLESCAKVKVINQN